MDARRCDRNADQLAQIFHHVSQLPQYHSHEVLMLRHDYLKLIEAALKINDKLGKMMEKGLI